MSCPDKPLISRKAKIVKVSYKDDRRFFVQEIHPRMDHGIKIYATTMGGVECLVFFWTEEVNPWIVEKKNVKWIDIDDYRVQAGQSYLR